MVRQVSTRGTDDGARVEGGDPSESGPTRRSIARLRTLRYILWGTILLAGLGFGGYELWHRTRAVPVSVEKEIGRASIRSDFSLVDHTGKAVTDEDFRGKWLLVFFGYTYCPDVCPTTLNEIAEVVERLGDKAAKVQPLFITIDPGRDTPERMAEYVAAFDPRIVGLTGTPEQIKAAAGSFRVYYEKSKDAETSDGYLMDHSAALYFMNPDGEFEAFFSFNDGVEEIVSGVRQRL